MSIPEFGQRVATEDERKAELDELYWAVGRANTALGHGDPLAELGGPVVKAIVMRNMNDGGSFTALFPYCDDATGLGGSLKVHRIIDDSRMRAAGVGTYARSELFEHDTARFVAAVNAFALPGVTIEWTFYDVPKYAEEHRLLDFKWEFVQGPPASQAQYDSSNLLELTPEQMRGLKWGVSVRTSQHLKMSPIVAYQGDEAVVAHVCSHYAWSNGMFEYFLSTTPQ